MNIISRKDALVKGLNRYYTGKPCKNGHVVERVTLDCSCINCNKDKQKRNRETNNRKKYLKEYLKLYRTANKEKQKEYKKKWRQNPDNVCKEKEYMYRYEKQNPEKKAKRTREYLYYKSQAIPQWYENDLIKQIYLKRDELSELWGIRLHVDHVVPLQGKNVCGLHCWDNLQLLEASLNISKSNNF